MLVLSGKESLICGQLQAENACVKESKNPYISLTSCTKTVSSEPATRLEQLDSAAKLGQKVAKTLLRLSHLALTAGIRFHVSPPCPLGRSKGITVGVKIQETSKSAMDGYDIDC